MLLSRECSVLCFASRCLFTYLFVCFSYSSLDHCLVCSWFPFSEYTFDICNFYCDCGFSSNAIFDTIRSRPKFSNTDTVQTPLVFHFIWKVYSESTLHTILYLCILLLKYALRFEVLLCLIFIWINVCHIPFWGQCVLCRSIHLFDELTGCCWIRYFGCHSTFFWVDAFFCCIF